MIGLYGRTLGVVLRHRALTLVVLLATIALTVDLYIKTPKGCFPQDDTGLIWGGTQASPDVSFKAMVELQRQVADIVLDGSGGAMCRLLDRRRRRRLGQPRQPVHQPEAAAASATA